MIGVVLVLMISLASASESTLPGQRPGEAGSHDPTRDPFFKPQPYSPAPSPVVVYKVDVKIGKDEIVGKCMIPECKNSQLILESAGKTIQIFNLDNTGSFRFRSLDPEKIYRIKLINEKFKTLIRENVHAGNLVEFND